MKTHPNDPSVQKEGGEEEQPLTATAAGKTAAAISSSVSSSQAPSGGQKAKSEQNGDSGLKNGKTSSSSGAPVEVKRENMPQLVNPKHVTLGGKDQLEPKKKKGCCSIM